MKLKRRYKKYNNQTAASTTTTALAVWTAGCGEKIKVRSLLLLLLFVRYLLPLIIVLLLCCCHKGEGGGEMTMAACGGCGRYSVLRSLLPGGFLVCAVLGAILLLLEGEGSGGGAGREKQKDQFFSSSY